MHEYLFDVKLFASLRIGAENEADARKKLAEILDCATLQCGQEGEEPLFGEVSLDDDDPDLIEIDGEDAEAFADAEIDRAEPRD